MTAEQPSSRDPYKVDIDGTDYYCVRGSDLDRDGMYLELSRPYGSVILEIFYSDQTGCMTLTTHQSGVPLHVVEWFVAAAKRSLPPRS